MFHKTIQFELNTIFPPALSNKTTVGGGGGWPSRMDNYNGMAYPLFLVCPNCSENNYIRMNLQPNLKPKYQYIFYKLLKKIVIHIFYYGVNQTTNPNKRF